MADSPVIQAQDSIVGADPKRTVGFLKKKVHRTVYLELSLLNRHENFAFDSKEPQGAAYKGFLLVSQSIRLNQGISTVCPRI